MTKARKQNLVRTTYGGCEGPDSEFIKLISSDGFEFIIKRDLAFQSDTIKAALGGPAAYSETDTNVVPLKEIKSHALHDVCRYMIYKMKYEGSLEEVPDFYIAPEAAVSLLLAAKFLGF